MFRVPKLDKRLANKDEILALSTQDRQNPIAISAKFLKSNPLYQFEHDDRNLLILTDKAGGNRVYELKPGERFSLAKDNTLIGPTGNPWRVDEARIFQENGQERSRYPAHRAFWFGWYSQFPDTQLIDHRGRSRSRS